MQDKIQDLIPVNGNRYHTSYGLYACDITASVLQGDVIKLTIGLRNETDGSQLARLYTIIGVRQAIEKKRLGLVMEIHKWALLDRSADDYLAKKVLIYEEKLKA